ncbi:MAG: ROK family protein, partial [Planctomycetota bacterium]|nr:ROK family protein [Planctomycetota bacterium]
MKSLGIDVGGTSVKAALFDTQTGEVLGRWNSGPYRRPDRAQLMEAVGEATSLAFVQQPGAIGLCCPGVVDPATGRITRSVNLPGLEGYPAASLVPGDSARIAHFTDAFAAAVDVYCSELLSGRLLAVSLGTGVGAAVIDPGPVQLLLH